MRSLIALFVFFPTIASADCDQCTGENSEAVSSKPVPIAPPPNLMEELRIRAIEKAKGDEEKRKKSAPFDELSNKIAKAIYEKVSENWSRPSSARNGMEVLIEMRLNDNGEVVGVRVVRGSGDRAFDQSAIAAVRKAKVFDLPKGKQAFEAFKVIQLLFVPEDLRR